MDTRNFAACYLCIVSAARERIRNSSCRWNERHVAARLRKSSIFQRRMPRLRPDTKLRCTRCGRLAKLAALPSTGLDHCCGDRWASTLSPDRSSLIAGQEGGPAYLAHLAWNPLDCAVDRQLAAQVVRTSLNFPIRTFYNERVAPHTAEV